MIKKVAFFDFDKTITDRDSIFVLFNTFKNKLGIKIIPLYFKLFYRSIGFLFGKDYENLKNEIAKIFKVLDEKDLEKFVKEDLSKLYYKDALKKLDELRDDNYYIMLVSASFEKYMKYAAKELKVDYLIGTDLDENFNIIGGNNKGKNKVKKIKKHLEEKGFQIDYENSLGFSDSYKDDRYMLELVKNRFLINSKVKKEGYKNLEWS